MKGYTSRDVARLLRLTVAQVRDFARDGFLTPGRGPRGELLFSCQDLVILRTAKGLVAARIPTRRIRRALRRLRTELPRGRSLAELRIAAEGDRIVVSDGEATWSPESDQMQIDFAISDLATRAAPMARRTARAARLVEQDFSAEDWYDLGLELEVAAPVEARDAYRRALELDAHHADATSTSAGCCTNRGSSRRPSAITAWRCARAPSTPRPPSIWGSRSKTWAARGMRSTRIARRSPRIHGSRMRITTWRGCTRRRERKRRRCGTSPATGDSRGTSEGADFRFLTEAPESASPRASAHLP